MHKRLLPFAFVFLCFFQQSNAQVTGVGDLGDLFGNLDSTQVDLFESLLDIRLVVAHR